jgi:hypothetical protein
METSKELTALQNSIKYHDLEVKVKLFFEQDKRKKPKFVLTNNTDAFISPKINYDKMNHFILGMATYKKYNLNTL